MATDSRMVLVHPLKVGNGPFVNNTYIIVNPLSREALLVDPGYEFDWVRQQLLHTGSGLVGILLTHHHTDHTRLAADFARSFDVPVLMSMIESDFYCFSCLNLQPVTPDRSFTIGCFDVFPCHTPGHTKGSTCFLVAGNLFTGDTLFIEGCGICSGKGADPVDMFHSLQKIRNSIDPTVNIYPGHSYGMEPGCPFSTVLLNNLYFHIPDINMFTKVLMRKRQLKT